jgi:hypothetical protein
MRRALSKIPEPPVLWAAGCRNEQQRVACASRGSSLITITLYDTCLAPVIATGMSKNHDRYSPRRDDELGIGKARSDGEVA